MAAIFPIFYRPAFLRRRGGFTLIEAAMVTIIVGLGITAAMQLFYACTMQNNLSARLTTGLNLASNIEEAMASLSFNDPITSSTHFGFETGETLDTYDDVDDFDGQTFNPPIDAARGTLTDLSQYSQVVSVVPVYPNKLRSNSNEASLEIPKTTYTGAVRVKVKVTYRARAGDAPVDVAETSWIRVDG